MNPPTPENTPSPIADALLRGQKIEAIKLYRESTGADLAAAKAAVEKLESELRAASPEKFATPAPAPGAGKGCLGIMVMACAMVGAVLAWGLRR
jgi:hypothetical protein